MTDSDITMSLDDTLELDTIIEKSSRASNPLNFDSSNFSSSGIQTHTEILEPQNTGKHRIQINGQELVVEVTDPNNIPNWVDHQWNAQSLEGFSNGDIVSNISDNIGSFDAISSGSSDTVYLSDGINNNPAIDCPTNAYFEYNPDDGFTIQQPITYSFVIQINSNNDNYFLFTKSAGGNDGPNLKSWNTDNYQAYSGNNLENTAFSDTTTPLVGIIIFDGENGIFRLNGNENTGNIGSRDAAKFIHFAGGVQPADIKFGEWNIGQTALSDDSITNEEKRLKNKWDITF